MKIFFNNPNGFPPSPSHSAGMFPILSSTNEQPPKPNSSQPKASTPSPTKPGMDHALLSKEEEEERAYRSTRLSAPGLPPGLKLPSYKANEVRAVIYSIIILKQDLHLLAAVTRQALEFYHQIVEAKANLYGFNINFAPNRPDDPLIIRTHSELYYRELLHRTNLTGYAVEKNPQREATIRLRYTHNLLPALEKVAEVAHTRFVEFRHRIQDIEYGRRSLAALVEQGVINETVLESIYRHAEKATKLPEIFQGIYSQNDLEARRHGLTVHQDLWVSGPEAELFMPGTGALDLLFLWAAAKPIYRHYKWESLDLRNPPEPHQKGFHIEDVISFRK